MKKVILHIALYAFIAFFVAMSGGLFFIIHHCSAHHETEIKFIDKNSDDCCHHADCDLNNQYKDHSCCTLAQEPSTGIHCCSNSPVFLKVSFHFINSSVEKIQVPVMLISEALPPALALPAGTILPCLNVLKEPAFGDSGGVPADRLTSMLRL